MNCILQIYKSLKGNVDVTQDTEESVCLVLYLGEERKQDALIIPHSKVCRQWKLKQAQALPSLFKPVLFIKPRRDEVFVFFFLKREVTSELGPTVNSQRSPFLGPGVRQAPSLWIYSDSTAPPAQAWPEHSSSWRPHGAAHSHQPLLCLLTDYRDRALCLLWIGICGIKMQHFSRTVTPESVCLPLSWSNAKPRHIFKTTISLWES